MLCKKKLIYISGVVAVEISLRAKSCNSSSFLGQIKQIINEKHSEKERKQDEINHKCLNKTQRERTARFLDYSPFK